MAVGPNPTPTGAPSWACGEDANFIQCKTAQQTLFSAKQLNGNTAGRRGSPGARPLSSQTSLLCSLPCWSALACAGLLRSAGSAPFCAVCSGLRWSALLCLGKTPPVFQLSHRNPVFRGRGTCAPEGQRGASFCGPETPIRLSSFRGRLQIVLWQCPWSERNCPDGPA